MKIEKTEYSYQATECDLKFGEQITLGDELLIPASVLDKIRAKVESINPWSLRYAPTYDANIRPQIVSNVKEHVLQIIEKYRAESEE